MRKLTPLDDKQHTLLARLSAINNGDDDILSAGSLGFRPDDYLSPSMRAGLKPRMKEKCSAAAWQMGSRLTRCAASARSQSEAT